MPVSPTIAGEATGAAGKPSRSIAVDSLTQLTVGAAIGEAVLGPKVGRKAMVWGAILGTLPDLDVLIPLDGPVEDFVYHRGFSHSLFLLALLAPLFAWVITRIHPDSRHRFREWWLLVFLVLEIGVLLDLMTVYGTQILWPFDTTPLAWPVLFIIDPLFTLPIVVGVSAAWFMRREGPLGHRLNAAGLIVAMVYLGWAFGVREYVNHGVRQRLEAQHVPYEQLISTPAPFTTLLWRFVGIDGDRYFETYASIFDGDTSLTIDHYPRNLGLLEGLEAHPPVAKLRWFTRGFYAASRVEDDIVMTDLRMGTEPTYVFSFTVAKAADSNPIPVPDVQREADIDWRGLRWVWRRIWDPAPP
jgi:inner membrane protein